MLLSGGVDSTTTLAIAKAQGFECHALSFSYGQRHGAELDAARRVAQAFGVDHKILGIDLRTFGGSALTADIAVPKDRPIDDSIPVTYVPARNTIFLSLALAWAEVLGAQDLFIGVNALDYSGYPDCRPEYIAAFQTLADLATKAGVEGARFRVHTPLIEMSKADIIRKGLELDVDYDLTFSCYDPTPQGTPCGHCDSCRIREEGFAAATSHSPQPTQS